MASVTVGQYPGSSPGELHHTAVRRCVHPAASCATRRALHAAARHGRTQYEQEPKKGTRPVQRCWTAPRSTPTRTRAQHSRTHTHDARRRAQGAGRAGLAGGRFGWYGGVAAAVPFSFVFRHVRSTCERGGHRGGAEGAGTRQSNGRDARRTKQGRQVGGLAVAGRSGVAAPFWFVCIAVRFVQKRTFLGVLGERRSAGEAGAADDGARQ